MKESDLPPCHKCGGKPIFLGDPHTDRLVCCEDCDNEEFDTCLEGAIWSWFVANEPIIGEYLKLNLTWKRLKLDKKEDTPEEEKLLSEMDFVWYKMSKDQIVKTNEILGFI